MVTLSDIVETRTCRVNEVALMGLQGQSMDEERNLFHRLSIRLNEVTAKSHENQYLVVSGKIPVPFVAVEVSEVTDVPEGMTAFTLSEGEYVAFKFAKNHVGDFWANICTPENQAKYKIDLSKPRFEIFTSDLQSTGLIEWYIPIHTPT